MSSNDPAIAAIREIRHRISAAHLHDPRLLIDYYRELEREYQSRVLPAPDVDTPSHITMPYAPPEFSNHLLAETRAVDHSDESASRSSLHV